MLSVVLFVLLKSIATATSDHRHAVSSLQQPSGVPDSWGVQYGTNFEDSAFGMVVDSSGDIYTVGYTKGSLFATNVGSTQDNWISKISGSDGSLIYGGCKMAQTPTIFLFLWRLIAVAMCTLQAIQRAPCMEL